MPVLLWIDFGGGAFFLVMLVLLAAVFVAVGWALPLLLFRLTKRWWMGLLVSAVFLPLLVYYDRLHEAAAAFVSLFVLASTLEAFASHEDRESGGR